MQREEANKVDTGSGLQSEHSLPTTNDLENPEMSASLKFECDGIDQNAVENGNKINEDASMAISDELHGCIKRELGNIVAGKIFCDGDSGDVKSSLGHQPSTGVLNDENCPKLESLGCSIEEGLEKFSLGANAIGSVVKASSMKDEEVEHVSKEDDDDSSPESESESESESDTSSSSASSSSSSSSSSSGVASSSSESDSDLEEEKEDEQSCKIMKDKTEQGADVEEGEILGSDAEKMVSWIDDDDSDYNQEDENDIDDEPSEDFEIGDDVDADDITMGPIKSKNELADLPPVPPVNVTLQPCHQISPVGAVLSILGLQVVVEGSEKHNPLSEGSILWLTEKRLPLGIVDEIFGPVKNPYYIVRYNSESELPSGIQIGTQVGFVPEFVDHVLNDKNLYQKGYDASGENDEELSNEVEFSDDEKEAEYRRMMKMSKRGINNTNQGPGNNRKNRKNNKSRDKTQTNDHPSVPRAQTMQPSQSNQQHHTSLPPPSSMSQGNQLGLSTNLPILPSGSSGPSSFPQQPQVPAGFVLNNLWANGMPFQQQNTSFPTGFQQVNGMPWFQPQNLPSSQMPLMTPPWQLASQFPSAQPQQAFDLSQLVSGSNSAVNFATGPVNPNWPGLLSPNPPSSQAPLMFSGSNAQFPVFQGMQSNGAQAGQNSNSQPPIGFPGNGGVRPQFNRGSSGAGRGRKPFHQRGRGGRFGGGRGHHRSK